MNRDDDKELWDLLGKGAEPKISPFFARNVVREIRQSSGHAQFRRWLNLRWLLPSVSVAMAIMAAIVFLRTPASMSNLARHDVGAAVEASASDSELMADMDDLLASDDNNSWIDSALL